MSAAGEQTGDPIHEGFTAFREIWPADASPPAITVTVVAALAVPGALVEIQALAAVRSAG